MTAEWIALMLLKLLVLLFAPEKTLLQRITAH